jgi:hypothetical protein
VDGEVKEMQEKLELLAAIFIIAGAAIGGFLLILIVQPLFWLAVIAYALVTNL